MSNITNFNSYGNYSNIYLYNNSRTNDKTNKLDNNISSMQTGGSQQSNALNDDEILNKIQNQTRFYQETWRKNIDSYTTNNNLGDAWFDICAVSDGEQIGLRNESFIKEIESKMQEKAKDNITSKDVKEAQRFLNEQMDSIMLMIYKSNPEVMEDTMEEDYKFYANNGLNRTININHIEMARDYPELKFDNHLSNLFLAYGIRTENNDLDTRFEEFLKNIQNNIQDKKIGGDIGEYVKKGVAAYRYEKMQMSGCNFFGQVTDMLSPALQEQITDAIAQVMSFYSQPNSVEFNGVKISWETQSITDTYGAFYHSFADIFLANIEIKYSQDFGDTTNDFLLSLSSNFDSSQTFFEVLEQRDKLEKENQELKTKQDYNAYGISKNTSIQTDSSSDSIMQTLLKESKGNKKNQGE
ncbi:hypothetical protein [Helicobacter ganmani]|uniref:hypothetical protein n=2 Tax=Helicobacter ganmani TaxID=60246 RepID=UPI003A877325